MSRSTDRVGAPVHFLRGTENENHVVQVDGADAGSFRLNFPGFFLGLSSEAVSDVQIKTAGVDAAAPLAAGMVINIATPSGTNELKGTLAAVYTARGLEWEQHARGHARLGGDDSARRCARRAHREGRGVVLRHVSLHQAVDRYQPQRHPARQLPCARAVFRAVRQRRPTSLLLVEGEHAVRAESPVPGPHAA